LYQSAKRNLDEMLGITLFPKSQNVSSTTFWKNC